MKHAAGIRNVWNDEKGNNSHIIVIGRGGATVSAGAGVKQGRGAATNTAAPPFGRVYSGEGSPPTRREPSPKSARPRGSRPLPPGFSLDHVNVRHKGQKAW